jgi:MFS family permease
MFRLDKFRKSPREISEDRRSLFVAVIEGFPALVIFQLLGGPFLTGYLLLLGASAEQIGFVLAISTLVNVAQVFMAVAMQKFRNRKAMLIIFGTLHRVLWCCVGLIPILFDKNWWVAVYILLFTLAHLSNALAAVVWTSLMADMVPASVRGRYLGIRNMILGAVSSLALFAGGQIMEHHPGIEGFNYLFIICGICAVLNMTAFCFYPNLPLEPSMESNPLGMIGKPVKDKQFLKAIIFLSVFLFLQGVSVPFFSYVMLKFLHISYNWISIITVVHTLVMMASYYFWGKLNARHSTKTLLLWSLPFIAGSCIAWGALPFLPTILVLLVVHALLGIGLGGFNQMVFTFIIGDTPKSERPMYIAAYSALTGFAAFLGPLLGGKIYKISADLPAWVQTYGISVVTGFILMVLGVAIGRMVLGEPRQVKQQAKPFM